MTILTHGAFLALGLVVGWFGRITYNRLKRVKEVNIRSYVRKK